MRWHASALGSMSGLFLRLRAEPVVRPIFPESPRCVVIVPGMRLNYGIAWPRAAWASWHGRLAHESQGHLGPAPRAGCPWDSWAGCPCYARCPCYGETGAYFPARFPPVVRRGGIWYSSMSRGRDVVAGVMFVPADMATYKERSWQER